MEGYQVAIRLMSGGEFVTGPVYLLVHDYGEGIFSNISVIIFPPFEKACFVDSAEVNWGENKAIISIPDPKSYEIGEQVCFQKGALSCLSHWRGN